MAYTTIDKPTDYFNTKLYTGDGSSSNAITGVGFQPDWVWLKARSSAYSHQLFDSVRGATKLLSSEETSAEQTLSGVTAFGSDGFTVGSDAGSNNNTTTFASWNWLASNTTASNTDGSITSTVSANTTSGFSIVKFNTNGQSGAMTCGHSLGAVPKMIILKPLVTDNWYVYHVGIGNAKYINLDTNSAETSNSNTWSSTTPTSSVFTMNTAFWGANTNDIIGYCFAEKKGFSKFGSYTGNGNADGPFIYTGFKPAWIITKSTGATGGWEMHDNKRSPFNSSKERLFAHDNNEEVTQDPFVDLLSNGFKIRATVGNINASTDYIYMAFAENPFVTSTGIPTTAR